MRNPYDVLGIPSSASIEQVKEAYRELARKYHPDNYQAGPLAKQAAKKMDEINEAYDHIVFSRSGDNIGNDSKSSSTNEYSSDLNDIRIKIKNGRIDDAEIRLDGISPSQRSAEWYFLKGTVNNRRGWLEEAKKNFTIACQMDPTNTEYQTAFDSISASRSSRGGYRTYRRNTQTHRDSSLLCNICNALICADCCCDCFCDDFIRCC